MEAIRAHGHRNAHYVGDLDAVVDRLAEEAKPGDLVLTLGAGSVSGIGEQLLDALGRGGKRK